MVISLYVLMKIDFIGFAS